MNKKILLIATLVLMTIVSLGAVSAADDAIDDVCSSDADEVVIGDEGGESPGPTMNELQITQGMTNDEIQQAFDNLEDNTIINFEAGTYENTNLKITKDKTVEETVLDGEGQPKLDEGGNVIKKNVTYKTTLNNIIINGNGATLTDTRSMPAQWGNYYDGIFEVANVNGFTLSGFNFILHGVKMANMKSPSCVIIYNTSNGIIENNNISGGRFGLYVGSKFMDPNYDAIVRNNTVTDVSDMGIISFGSARTHIYNNTIINPVNHGIDVRHGSGPNCIVENNTIIGAREGIYLMHSQGHKAINNILNFCDVGITCYGSSNIFCDENKFINNTKIGFLLASGYINIKIGENNDYSGLVFVPMPPTFTYNIVKADGAYIAATNGTFSQIVPVETTINASALTTVAKTNKNLVVTLFDEKGNPLANKNVTVSINGKTSTVTTNADGKATIKTNFAAAGTYYYSICFLGDESCKASYKTVKVTVNKQAVKASFAKATLKVKKAKKVTFTLKDANGKALSGKKITITVNKKTFSAKTNSKGVATISVKVAKKGKFTATAKFAGDSAYKAITKKATFTVKK